MAGLVLLTALLIVGLQLILLWKKCYQQREQLYCFYKKLHNARKDPEIAPSSYRHLREHGNAFFIVMLELGLLAIILSWIKLFDSSLYWPLLLAVWIAPGAAVYFIGHVLEAEMVRKNQNVQEDQ